jgi:hypothetical protein
VSGLQSAGNGHAEPAAPESEADALAAPPGDPQALASWFESEVLRELEARSGGGADPQRVAVALGWGEGAGAPGSIDWAYLRDVYAGRISGIPDERRAGISLQQMDQLGDVPYVEALRADGRLDELRELGFEPTVIEAPEPGEEARFPLNPRLEPAH